jgi:transposase
MTDKKVRRHFTAQFKQDAVQLVMEHELPVAQVARELDIGESSLTRWVSKARAHGAASLTGTLKDSEHEELQRLRRENQILRQEREILKKAAVFFARES